MQGPKHLGHPLLLSQAIRQKFGWMQSSWNPSWCPYGILVPQGERVDCSITSLALNFTLFGVRIKFSLESIFHKLFEVLLYWTPTVSTVWKICYSILKELLEFVCCSRWWSEDWYTGHASVGILTCICLRRKVVQRWNSSYWYLLVDPHGAWDLNFTLVIDFVYNYLSQLSLPARTLPLCLSAQLSEYYPLQ